jgi:hypothetical protein
MVKLHQFIPEGPAEHGNDGRIAYSLYYDPAYAQAIYILGGLGTHSMVLLRQFGAQECQMLTSDSMGFSNYPCPKVIFRCQGCHKIFMSPLENTMSTVHYLTICRLASIVTKS